MRRLKRLLVQKCNTLSAYLKSAKFSLPDSIQTIGQQFDDGYKNSCSFIVQQCDGITN